MAISLTTKQAYSEVYEFINMLDITIINKVPIYIMELFKEERDKNYTKKIDISRPIKEQGLKDETLTIIAMLNLEYWCEDETEKERLKKAYKRNQELEESIEKVGFDIKLLESKKQENNLIEIKTNPNKSVLVKLLEKIIGIFRK